MSRYDRPTLIKMARANNRRAICLYHAGLLMSAAIVRIRAIKLIALARKT